jgi:hypothetical protein
MPVYSVVAFATRLAVGAQAPDIHLAVATWRGVLVGVAPRVVRQALQVAARLPVLRCRATGRLAHQRLQALLGGGVARVIQTVELEALQHGADILLGGHDARLVRAAHHLGHHQRGQHAENDDDHHDLDQGKAALGGEFAVFHACSLY